MSDDRDGGANRESVMASREPGKMPIDEQVENYNIFWAWSIRTTVIVVIILVLMYIFLT